MSEGGEARNHEEAVAALNEALPYKPMVNEWDLDSPDPFPQGEDHEAGIEAALHVAHEGPFNLCNMGSDTCETRPQVARLIAAYLSRCPSPERNTEKS